MADLRHGATLSTWTLDHTRQWWCHRCRRFTDWEFRKREDGREDERCTQHSELCPSGCGCRKGTNDPDRNECACAGPCCYDPEWAGDD